MAKIQAILFDLGDTLLEFGPVNIMDMFARGARLAYTHLERMGMPMPAFRSFHRRQLTAVRWRYLWSRITGREFNSLDVLGRLSRRMGHNLDAAQMVDLAWLYYKPLANRARMEPGLAEVLGRLREQGLKLGIISNTFVPGQVLDRHMQMAGVLEYFPLRVYSCDVRYRKPDRRIFRIASERLGVAEGATIFVGDSPKADIRGANRAGMISVLKDPADIHQNPRYKPAHRIRRLNEIPDIVTSYG